MHPHEDRFRNRELRVRDACCASLRASPPAPPVRCETAESLFWATNPTLRRLPLRCNAFPAPTCQSLPIGSGVRLPPITKPSYTQDLDAPIARVITMPSSLPVLESRIGHGEKRRAELGCEVLLRIIDQLTDLPIQDLSSWREICPAFISSINFCCKTKRRTRFTFVRASAGG